VETPNLHLPRSNAFPGLETWRRKILRLYGADTFDVWFTQTSVPIDLYPVHLLAFKHGRKALRPYGVGTSRVLDTKQTRPVYLRIFNLFVGSQSEFGVGVGIGIEDMKPIVTPTPRQHLGCYL